MTFRVALYWSLVLCLCAEVSVPDCQGAAQPNITPYQAEVFFSRTALNSASPPNDFVGKPVWTDQIREPSGRPLYDISLEPQFDVRHYLVSLWLVLKDVDKPTEKNLLWCDMGLEPFMFVARLSTHGPTDSVYGRTRTIPSCAGNIIIKASIVDAEVSTIPDSDDFQWDVLHLSISAQSVQNGALTSPLSPNGGR